MKTTIYYFSATGNSLAVAKELSSKLIGDVELISIRECVKKGKQINISSDKTGILYPVYAYGSPRIVKDFFKLIINVKTDYLFSIATCGGNPAGAMSLMKKRVASLGSILNAGFMVTLPSPEGTDDLGLIKFMKFISGKSVETWATRSSEIIDIINNSKDQNEDKQHSLSRALGNFFHNFSMPVFPKLDSNFFVDENCKGCGVCKKVCPSNNIVLKDNKPCWGGNCEQCIGCMQWCPSVAIHNSEKSKKYKRYHHSDVTFKEITQ